MDMAGLDHGKKEVYFLEPSVNFELCSHTHPVIEKHQGWYLSPLRRKKTIVTITAYRKTSDGIIAVNNWKQLPSYNSITLEDKGVKILSKVRKHWFVRITMGKNNTTEYDGIKEELNRKKGK